MNVLTVGLLCIAVYGVLVVLWLRYDANRTDHSGSGKGGRS